jgi:hypothetical protein
MQHVQRSCCMESYTQDALYALDELIPATLETAYNCMYTILLQNTAVYKSFYK